MKERGSIENCPLLSKWYYWNKKLGNKNYFLGENICFLQQQQQKFYCQTTVLWKEIAYSTVLSRYVWGDIWLSRNQLKGSS